MSKPKVIRVIINKSTKRKVTNGDNKKANYYTRMVVYKTEIAKGKYHSVTKHEMDLSR